MVEMLQACERRSCRLLRVFWQWLGEGSVAETGPGELLFIARRLVERIHCVDPASEHCVGSMRSTE